ncbi:MAG: hypothetical protein ACJ8FY_21310 [Gemmataceae bacterium]
MTVITADAALQALLAPLREKAEIRGEDGKVLGHFTPCVRLDAKSRHELADLFDLAEAERALAEDSRGSSLAEVWKRILAHQSKE